MDNILLFNKLAALPDHLKAEAADFIEFLSMKSKKKSSSKKPKFGSAKGMFKMAPDFDEPLDDFKDYM